MLKNQWSSEADMIIQPANDEEVLEKNDKFNQQIKSDGLDSIRHHLSLLGQISTPTDKLVRKAIRSHMHGRISRQCMMPNKTSIKKLFRKGA
jgi:hypothetical protein